MSPSRIALAFVANRRCSAGDASTLVARVRRGAARVCSSQNAGASGGVTNITFPANALSSVRREHAHCVGDTGAWIVGGSAWVAVGENTASIRRDISRGTSVACGVRHTLIGPSREAGALGSRASGELNNNARSLAAILVDARVVLNHNTSSVQTGNVSLRAVITSSSI